MGDGCIVLKEKFTLFLGGRFHRSYRVDVSSVVSVR